MKLYTLDQCIDRSIGKKGTPLGVQSILKEISPERSLEGLMLKLKL